MQIKTNLMEEDENSNSNLDDYESKVVEESTH